MTETRITRGRKVVYEREPPRGPVEDLRYTVDVLDAGDNLNRGRLADLSVAQAALRGGRREVSRQTDLLRQMCRVIRSSDRHG